MAKRLYDLAVKTGSYEKNGETKGRYENVGSVMQSDDGSKFIMLKRCFNPAGVPFKDGSDAILVSMFTPKDQQGGQQHGGGQPQRQAPAPAVAAAGKGDGFEDDDIPF